MVKVKLIDQRVKIKPGRSKTIKLRPLNKPAFECLSITVMLELEICEVSLIAGWKILPAE